VSGHEEHAFHATLIELIETLAAGDPRSRRFGASTHRWARRPVLAPARVAAIEAAAGVELPDDYRGYLLAVGDGGAGPYHGILPLDHPAQLALLPGPCALPAVPAPVAALAGPWRGVVAIADLGCDQLAVLVVDGPARGTVWADARAAGIGILPFAASFTALITAALVGAARGELPPAIGPADACAIPRLLSALLAHEEERLGRDPGTLAGPELHAALAGLAPGAISIASMGTALHEPGESIAPCVRCAVLVDNLAASGLDPAAIAAPDVVRMLRDVRPPG
jgi:hypothetical protein